MSLVFIMFSISINLLVALAIDRYCAVCHPLFHFAHKNSGFRKWIIIGIVIFGMALGSLPGLGWHNESFYSCYVMDVVSFGFMIICCVWSLGATTIIVILYGLIYKKIINHVSFNERKLSLCHYKFLYFRCVNERFFLHHSQ